MTTEIITRVRRDNEGCVIATAEMGSLVCHYDGDDYTGNASDNQDLRIAAKAAFVEEVA